MLNKPPLSMIDAGQESGEIVSTGKSLGVAIIGENIATTLECHYDSILGTLTLSIPGFPKVQFNGFLTNRDLKEGRKGDSGYTGTDGIDGLAAQDGEKGTRGCEGPRGPRGKPGQRGERGQRGPEGAGGNKGQEGERGKAGQLMVFIQKEDPGPVGASAIWVKR